ncbi:uncharacterized protein si:ch211-1a19.3 [Girardinichthys multiradiatus]|uniref:uncharacterized protein si:ch211-1a19.3 n=1 Tax=Girardinichthys multiradiatus TaxID=208333 RepID=UPI001FAD17D4|nr:uncharacterized protein si:ch211-1a19.3 [Girardinichthys multiradiatus]
MANGFKNTQKVQIGVIGLLVVWSIISIIIIVVWATSPDLKGSAQCRAELRDMTTKLEGAKVQFRENKMALEEQVLEAREDQDQLKRKILLLERHLNTTNTMLEKCQQKNVALAMNVTALQEDIRLLQQKEANLTEKLSLQEEHIEALQVNLTEAVHQNNSWFSLKEAAESHVLAAQSQTKACEARKQLLEKQIQKCKTAESETQQDKGQSGSSAPSPSNTATAPLAGIPAMTLLVCAALHLTT